MPRITLEQMVKPCSFCRPTGREHGMELTDIIRYFGALALVLALVGAAAVAMRKYGAPQFVGSRKRRLAVVEQLMLGSRHRLYLVRCDASEHLVVLGPQGATLVNTTQHAPFALPEGVQS
jgi:flagellar protein FliO/FliZ